MNIQVPGLALLTQYSTRSDKALLYYKKGNVKCMCVAAAAGTGKRGGYWGVAGGKPTYNGKGVIYLFNYTYSVIF